MAHRYNLLPKQRLEAFSDGVAAIAITLLVLEIKVPTESEGLGAALLAEWRTYLAYLISFAFIGGWWIAHSNLTRFVRHGNGVFFRLNLLALLFVSIVPFSASLMSAHSGDSGAGVATMVFGIDLFLASLMLSLLGTYVGSHKEIVENEVAEKDVRAFVRGRWWSVGLLVVAIAVTAVSPQSAIVLYLVCTILFIVEPLVPRRSRVSTVSGGAGGDEKEASHDDRLE
jgi:uncharacterized membrane protein